jgi:probable F420-dependent oxidoreductase
MHYAVTLPQLGRAASGRSIRDTARLAEDLGFSDVWVNDHIGFAPETDHPSPRMYEPLTALAMAAAVTERIGLGTQITAAYYPPIFLARTLASLDALSEGRLKVAIGVGWQPQEFAVLDSDYRTRGGRTDEIVAILRQVWATGSSAFSGDFYSFPDVRITPPPAHRIPIWIAGSSSAAHDRAVRLGDGFHGLPTRNEPVNYHLQCGVSTVPATVEEMRQARPDPEDFTISLYTHEWDPGEFDADVIRRERDFFAEARVQHVVAAFAQRDAASWMRSVERLAMILDL